MKPTAKMLLFIILGINILIQSSFASGVDIGAHLFILSGQSNMVHMEPEDDLVPELNNHFGEENGIVVKFAKVGQPIRRWYKNWEVTENQNPDQIGDLYDVLMENVQTAIEGKSIQSVTFIWMQGEHDAKEDLSDKYKASFLGVLEQIKADLNISKLNFVIGRISDSCHGKEHWDEIRRIQVELAENDPKGAWVNTDDLNDGLNEEGDPIENDLHYSVEGYKILGHRFTISAMSLSRKKTKVYT